MKAFLMYQDHDFDLQKDLLSNVKTLTQDLELNTLFNAMALGDKFLYEVARKAVLSSLLDLDTIRYRQKILRDCFENSAVVKDIYDIAVESIESQGNIYWGYYSKYPNSILYRAIEVMQLYVRMLKKLKNIANEHADKFKSEGFNTFFAMLKKELDDEYFTSIQNHLGELKFRHGVLISAELGGGNKGSNYILRKAQEKKQGWVKRIFTPSQPVFSLYISDGDESGFRALAELKDRGVNLAANALAQSTDHILSFFSMLRTELAFYIGCLNLHGQLTRIDEPMSFPIPAAPDERSLSFDGLYDVCLSLTMNHQVVGNDVTADNKNLVIITGANQGGKSTFLRSIGLAQLMMQCGMFTPTESFCSNICDNLFTHCKKEEDPPMVSGRLGEELSRMSDIVEKITPNSLLLFNESFAATNEREGSEIARQVISALLGKRIQVFYVTHLYEFAHSFFEMNMENAIFLRAERQTDGERTFKLTEGEPMQTSYGEDLFYSIFGTDN